MCSKDNGCSKRVPKAGLRVYGFSAWGFRSGTGCVFGIDVEFLRPHMRLHGFLGGLIRAKSTCGLLARGEGV